ncbi:hypothetical protein QJS04_geneDACA015390 [Acorus gramineus]|uniref:Protein FAR1-RELATED SEQUENCE n=1 Tax=Acorus gramineus TaxID=55184 RepID=A0AAV9A7A1_ACOGR|nr:hypothetical protein QJS04_geneDACA015390 [Acorus gramineus]
MIFCNLVHVSDVGCIRYFVVDDISKGKDGVTKKIAYQVHFDEGKQEVKCLCCLFEFRGILCRHSMKVLIHINMMEVSQNYILDRWQKGIKRMHNYVKNCYVDNMSNEQMWRHHDLHSKFISIADVAVVSPEMFELCKNHLDVLYNDLTKEVTDHNDCSVGDEQIPNSIVHSPYKVRSKGRPPSRRKAPKVYKPRSTKAKLP